MKKRQVDRLWAWACIGIGLFALLQFGLGQLQMRYWDHMPDWLGPWVVAQQKKVTLRSGMKVGTMWMFPPSTVLRIGEGLWFCASSFELDGVDHGQGWIPIVGVTDEGLTLPPQGSFYEGKCRLDDLPLPEGEISISYWPTPESFAAAQEAAE